MGVRKVILLMLAPRLGAAHLSTRIYVLENLGWGNEKEVKKDLQPTSFSMGSSSDLDAS